MLDKLQKLSADQAFAATAVCTDSYPLGAAGRDIGRGKKALGIRFIVKAAAKVSGGTETYELQAVTATDDDGTTGQKVIASSGQFSTADAAIELALGKIIDVPIPPGRIPATATHLTGKLVGANAPAVTLDAYIIALDEEQGWKPYPGAVTQI